MFFLNFFVIFTCLILARVKGQQKNGSGSYELPAWITTNPAYLNPVVLNSMDLGFGTIWHNKSENVGWVVDLNSEPGYGIEISLDELRLGTDNDDYLIIGGWPVSTREFKKLKLYTGTFTRTQKLRILNTKSFFVLFNGGQSKVDPKLVLSYKRYGNSYGGRFLPTTVKPIVKDTIFEVYLKGRKPQDYFDEPFLNGMKEAIRVVAKIYCQSNQIKFNDSITTQNMVFFHKISFCPFEWPDRDVCAIVEHSVFVSGVKTVNDLITLDYELTSEHLQDMWQTGNLSKIQELGIVVFKLPETTSVITLWIVGISVVIISSIIMISIFWKIERKLKGTKKQERRSDSFAGVTLNKKPKFKSTKSQQNPQFMLQSNMTNKMRNIGEGSMLNIPSSENLINDDEESKTQQPLKNYIGSILFFSNEALDEDEGVQETAT